MVFAFWTVYFTTPEATCYQWMLYFSGFWLIAQWLVIGFMVMSHQLPMIARQSITLLILISNIWFGLLIFSLQPCGG
ncbi:hypothetical protein [Pleionea mediterranea]|jgi:hypothetical protein|uniref:hypothetical protein n=1 Tax=Pleionea mediterranea TaxID=523701 RepID=UPI001FE120FF|nr:hypothetical protein [Pleionea mediterranea]